MEVADAGDLGKRELQYFPIPFACYLEARRYSLFSPPPPGCRAQSAERERGRAGVMCGYAGPPPFPRPSKAPLRPQANPPCTRFTLPGAVVFSCSHSAALTRPAPFARLTGPAAAYAYSAFKKSLWMVVGE